VSPIKILENMSSFVCFCKQFGNLVQILLADLLELTRREVWKETEERKKGETFNFESKGKESKERDTNNLDSLFLYPKRYIILRQFVSTTI
jgi:hypothetical protein